MSFKYLVLVLITFYAVKLFLNIRKEPYILNITFLDVGQGDSTLIMTGTGKKLLVDGGPDYSLSSSLVSKISNLGCHIDYVLLTHPHFDHLNGLLRLLDLCTYDNVFYTPITYKSRTYENFLAKTARSNTTSLRYGQFFKLDTSVTLYVLWPDPEHMRVSNNANFISTAFLLDYKDFEAVFTGDLEKQQLDSLDLSLLRNLVQGGVDILKVPHHGSSGSLSNLFYENIHPKVCVISSGSGNSYGHPHEEVLNYLKDINCVVRRTDHEGTIEILVDRR